MDKATRIIESYCGVLPGAQHYRHLLICHHLRAKASDEGLEPFRTQPESTHELWIWYQRRKPVGKRILLFRCQFNAGHDMIEKADREILQRRLIAMKLALRKADENASFVTRFLANRLTASSLYGALKQKDSDSFWSIAVERALKRCDMGGDDTQWQNPN